MFVNSQGGFVLFGSKPSCVEGVIAPEIVKSNGLERAIIDCRLICGKDIKFGKDILPN